MALAFVFCVNMSSSNLRLFTIDPFVSLLPATDREYFILVLSLPFKVPLEGKNILSNFKHNRTTILNESKWRFRFLTISFRFRDI